MLFPAQSNKNRQELVSQVPEFCKSIEWFDSNLPKGVSLEEACKRTIKCVLENDLTSEPILILAKEYNLHNEFSYYLNDLYTDYDLENSLKGKICFILSQLAVGDEEPILLGDEEKSKIELLDLAIELVRNNNVALFSLGTDLRKSENFNESLKCFNILLEKEVMLADTYLARGAVYMYSLQVENAIADFEEAGELEPKLKDVEYYKMLGQAYEKQNKFELALDCFNQAIEIDEDSEVLHRLQGRVLEKKGSYTEAREAFERAIELDQDNEICYLYLGRVLCRLNKPATALENFEKVKLLNPNDKRAFLWAGNTYFRLGDFPEALAEFEKALAIDSNFVRAYKGRVKVLMSISKFEEAKEDLQILVNLNPKDPQNFYQLSLAYRGINKYNEAIKSINKAINIKADNPFFYMFRADLNRDAYYYADAVSDYKKALEVDNDIRSLDNVIRDEISNKIKECKGFLDS